MLEEEVRILRRELQASVESFEATNEELKASNEEVTSINEELQSANEELETGKEELQALNEELVTVNTQLQSKLLELEALTNDLDNLLSSTDIAVVFLDTELRVRRFTPAVSDLLELIPADIGRPLAHLAQKFTDGDLIADARLVLAKLARLEAEALSHSGRWYLRRTLPYRTEDNRIAGVVITFIEITARKHAEQALQSAQARLQSIIEQMPAAVLIAEAPSGKLLLANRQASALFNQPFPLPFMGHDWTAAYSAFRGIHRGRPTVHADEWPLARALAKGETVLDAEIDLVRADGSPRTFSVSASPIRNFSETVVAAVATFWDVTERRRARERCAESEERFRMLMESARTSPSSCSTVNGRIVTGTSARSFNGFERRRHPRYARPCCSRRKIARPPYRKREMRRAMETGRALDERWHMRKDETRFWASGVLTVAHDTAGAPQGFVKVMRDQTARKETDARLQEALRSAQQLRAQCRRRESRQGRIHLDREPRAAHAAQHDSAVVANVRERQGARRGGAQRRPGHRSCGARPAAADR